MGGSLARALTTLAGGPRVLGWSPAADEREAALGAGAVSEAPARWEDAVAGAELVVLAMPLRATCAMLAEVARATPEETTLSDVASLKAPLARAAERAGIAARWVGAHPMAGSERSGFAASRADLFRDARVWTAVHESAEPRLGGVHALWHAIGARPARIGWDEHDRLMSVASHLPQLAANALAAVLADAGVTPDQLGPGGRDMTRLAASNPLIWRDLLSEARPELVEGLRALGAGAERVADLLEAGELEAVRDLMVKTRAWRRS